MYCGTIAYFTQKLAMKMFSTLMLDRMDFRRKVLTLKKKKYFQILPKYYLIEFLCAY